MSTNKKKETRTKYIGTYDLDKYIPGSWDQTRREPDAIDRVLNDQAKMLAQQARHMQVKTYIKQMELDQKKMDQELTNTMNPSSNPQSGELAKLLLTNPNVQAQWLAMNPEARAILMASATTLSQQGQSASSLANYMPFMLMQMKNNPATSAKEMVELINMLKLGNPGKNETAELIKALTPLLLQKQQGKGGISEVITALAPFLSQMAQKDQALLLERLRNMESRIIDPIDVLKSIGANAELLGFTKGSPNIEVEKLRASHQEKLMMINFEHQKWRNSKDLEIVAEKGRRDMMSQLVNKGLDTAQPLLNRLVSNTVGEKKNPPKPQTVTALRCVDCGTAIPVKGEPAAVTCPMCGLVHKKNVLGQPSPPPPKVQAGHSTFTMEK